jgi:hypothetical protein
VGVQNVSKVEAMEADDATRIDTYLEDNRNCRHMINLETGNENVWAQKTLWCWTAQTAA